jgi:predicted DNA-binding transcriptional regulator AlpA
MIDEMLSQKDLSKIFQVSRGTIYLWIKEKPDFPKSIKIGRKLLWKKSEIAEYMEKNRKE